MARYHWVIANLRYADSASMRTLVMAAMKVRTRAGSVTLLDPQPPVARMLDLLRVDEMFLDPGPGG